MTCKKKKLYLLTLLSGLASGLTAPIIYIFIINKGISIAEVSILITAISLTMILFEVPSGLLAERFGKSKAYTLSLILNVLFSFGIFYFDDLPSLLLFMFFGGLAMSLASGTLEAILINGVQEQENKSEIVQKRVAALKSARVVGIVIGAVFSLLTSLTYLYFPSYYSTFDYMDIGFIAMCFMYAVQLPISLTIKDEQYTEQHKPTFLVMLSESILSLKRENVTRVLMLSTLVFAVGVIAIEKFWQIRLSQLIEERSLPWLFSVAFICASLTSLIGHAYSTKLCDLFDNNFNAVLVFCRVLCACAFLTIFLSDALWVFIFGLLVVNFAFSASQSVLSALLHANVENSKRAASLSYLSCFNQLGGIIGIGLMAVVASSSSIAYVFLVSGIVIMLSAGFHIRKLDSQYDCAIQQ
ncbi:MFS transporter [Pseudoalteromonas aurantia]|uniref:Major facilitator superfamily (MFS) profile domain-containing protein n=1 Tax=Pseudoalteromonas aurantia TaxID=43654 RepID=A0A5S3VCL0_9GAMM|nr:MFS transporter [Pseudoalteromonas aurantia]TMO69882.1 hypothetical protein CWC19_03335 [Pseudoalteromonas aurantia]TMO75139.1 hypothetical protein CWC20_08700 [Pseudoalteromonas aurantia]